MNLRKLMTISALVAVVYLAFPMPTYAYLDPGTGSFIFQLVIAGLAGAAFVARMYWDKIKAIFSKNTDEDEDVADA